MNKIKNAYIWMLRRLPYVRQLELEHDKAVKDAQDLIANRVTVKELVVRNGTITAAFGTEMASVLCEGFGPMLLDTEGAKNYLEMQMVPAEGSEVAKRAGNRRLCLTLRWVDGKTPATVAEELRQQVKSLEEKWLETCKANAEVGTKCVEAIGEAELANKRADELQSALAECIIAMGFFDNDALWEVRDKQKKVLEAYGKKVDCTLDNENGKGTK